MKDSLPQYLLAFKKLKVDRAHGIAPHKHILLISVLQAYHSKLITNNKIYITPELVGLFKTNWTTLVTTKHDCRFTLPFYHLTSDKFWKLIPKQGYENVIAMSNAMRSFGQLNMAVDFALINDDLVQLMKDEKHNRILLQFLLDEYFPDSKTNFNATASNQIKLFEDLDNKILHEDAEAYRQEIKQLLSENNDEEIYLRSAAFKREVPKIYNYTCCISGMSIDAIANVSMIDACHIIPFSERYNDIITNGISLCPNLHRAFDRGLITIDTHYKVKISNIFSESKSNYSLKQFEGKKITLPLVEKYHPSMENFVWHQENIYKE
ncbi:MAG: HNH endonuclease [Bacteroidota bacterium]